MQIELGKIEKPEAYTDTAFRKGKKRIGMIAIKNRSLSAEDKYKHLEGIRLSVIKDSLCNDMGRILVSFPQYSELEYFYKELFACFIDVDKYKRSLAAVKWAQQKISSIYRILDRELRKKKTKDEIRVVRNIFLARSESVLKQIKNDFTFLEGARKQIKDMPNVKTSIFTVAIAGFPNVGKSTLLGKLTDSKPEVKSYAFTTKGLMIGYIRNDKDKIQMIDTPGSLNRFNKMNKIEKMAEICIKHIADLVVYIFDLTETYDISDQIELYNDLIKLKKNVIVYFSKSDIINKEIIDEFEIDGISDAKELKKKLILASQSE